MDIWDGLSRARTELGATRASAGLDHEEVIRQIQATQNAVNAGGGAQVEANRLAIIVNADAIGVNVTDIGTNVTDISDLTIVVGTNTTNIGTNTTDISDLTIVVGTNTTNIGTNTTDISDLTIVVDTNTTNIGTNVTDISNLTIVVGTNTSNISTNTTNIGTNADDIDALEGMVTPNLQNRDSPLVKCTPVRANIGSPGIWGANSTTQPDVIGLLLESTANLDYGDVQTTGLFTATTGEWDAVTNQTGGLSQGETYYLYGAGSLATTPPTTGYIAPVGVAISTTKLRIGIKTTILL